MVDSPLFDNEIDSSTIYIPNLLTSDAELNPIFCIGTDLNPALDLDEYDDLIPGWYYDELGQYFEIVLTEQMANDENRMVIIYNGGYPEFDEDKIIDKKKYYSLTDDNEFKVEEISTTIPYINSFQINYRYEESGDSEYNMRIVTLYDGGYTSISTPYHIKDVKSYQIGNIHYDDYVMDYSNSILSQYIVFYEHDWYASYKPVSMVGTGGPLESTTWIEVRMTGTDQWYQKIWLNYSGTPFQTFYSKGFVDIHAHL